MMTNAFEWKPFSPLAKETLADSTAWLNIAVGSVRSGKTIVMITRFIEFILTSPNTNFMLCGKTLITLERNVVRPMKAMLRSIGITVEQNNFLHELYFEDNVVSLFGVGKKGDEEKIQGSTFAGTLIDEGTVVPEEVFKMILSRNSEEGAMIFITCNPANPNHFLYKEYLTNDKLISEGKLRSWNFTLDDNYTLSDEYVENLKASYPEDSLFYKRYIQGLWVSGQGAIYVHFNSDNKYSEDRPLEYYDSLSFGSDYGASSTTCFNLVGAKYFDDHVEYDIIDEGGHDAQQEGSSLTDEEVVDMIVDMQNRYGLDERTVFYVSHDASSLEASLLKRRKTDLRLSVEKFTPDVMACISRIGSLFYDNYLRIHTRCVNTIRSVEGYEWDSSAARRGEDRPLKQDDHYCDSIRAPLMVDVMGRRIVANVIHL